MIDLLIKLADLPTDLPAIQAIRRAVFQEELYKDIVLEAEMETMKLQAHIGADGMLLLQMPINSGQYGNRCFCVKYNLGARADCWFGSL
jgi:hypothetical protein